jgi:hypothetical protein
LIKAGSFLKTNGIYRRDQSNIKAEVCRRTSINQGYDRFVTAVNNRAKEGKYIEQIN